jgi:hypothetical protein
MHRQITLVGMLCIVSLCSHALGTVGADQKQNEQSYRFLQEHGYQTDTPEQTQTALSDASVFGLACRNHALIILTEQMGAEAVPILKDFLYNDDKIAVHITAARLLGTLGDQSGLEVMQQDFSKVFPEPNDVKSIPRDVTHKPENGKSWNKRLVSTDNLSLVNDPNVVVSPETVLRWKKASSTEKYDVLQIAEVLAELGDCRAYELAVMMCFIDPYDKEGKVDFAQASRRTRAVDILADINKKPDAELKNKRMYPVAVLSNLAEVEVDSSVFRGILLRARQMKYEHKKEVLEKADKCAHKSDINKKYISGLLKSIKKEDAKEN